VAGFGTVGLADCVMLGMSRYSITPTLLVSIIFYVLEPDASSGSLPSFSLGST